MYRFQELKPLTYDAFTPIWDEVETRWKVALTINIANNKKITPEDQFRVFYKQRHLKYFDPEVARVTFHTIFQDNLFMVMQIEQYVGKLNELSNLANWDDVTTSEMTVVTDGVNNMKSGNLNINKSGASDSNSNNNPEYINKHFALEGEVSTALNTLNVNLTQDIGVSTNTSNSNNKTQSRSSAGNKSTDLITFINLELPELRRRFWSCFSPLFK